MLPVSLSLCKDLLFYLFACNWSMFCFVKVHYCSRNFLHKSLYNACSWCHSWYCWDTSTLLCLPLGQTDGFLTNLFVCPDSQNSVIHRIAKHLKQNCPSLFRRSPNFHHWEISCELHFVHPCVRCWPLILSQFKCQIDGSTKFILYKFSGCCFFIQKRASLHTNFCR